MCLEARKEGEKEAGKSGAEKRGLRGEMDSRTTGKIPGNVY